MTAELNKGRLYIDNKEVKTVTFEDGTILEFPIVDNNVIKSNGGSLYVKGNDNVTIQGNNPGTVITINKINNADFR